MAGLGLPAQTAGGPHGSIAVSMPPPLGALAASGSFVRVFFAHSPLLDAAASSLTLAVNGRPLTAMQLDRSTADGSTFEAPVPAFLLHEDGPNLVEARFSLQVDATSTATSTAAASSATYARLDPQTYVHYQVFGPPGSHPSARLDGYPFPLIGGGGSGRVGLLLPQLPSDPELTAALRLTADLGRRGYAHEFAPQVVTSGHSEWLRGSGAPALVVGSLRRLPVAGDLLRAAGFAQTPTGAWSGPAGEAIGSADGLLVPLLSPWDGRSPLLLASGITDLGVARAVAALTATDRPGPAGRYLVVSAGRSRPAEREPRHTAIQLPAPPEAEAVRAFGAGSHAFTFPFLLSPVDPHRSAALQVAVSHSEPAGPSTVSLRLNGRTFATVPLRADERAAALLRLSAAGSLLRPGLNTLTVEFQLAAGAGSSAGPMDGVWAGLMGGGRLIPPGPPPRPGALELLPDPLFGERSGVLVVVARREDSWLTAAAATLASLGGRTTSLPALEATAASDFRPASLAARGLIVVGAPRSLGGGFSHPGTAVAATGQSGGAPSWASLSLRPLSSSSPRPALWLDGSGPDMAERAARLLHRHPLPGSALAVDREGRSWPLEQATNVGLPEPLLVPALWWLTGLGVIATVLGVCWQVLRPAGPRP
jgi:hypothetical protein